MRRSHFSLTMRADAAATLAPRIALAYAAFAETLRNIVPMPEAESEELAALYVRAKLAKLDLVMGRISVTHGAYLDPECIATVRRNHAAASR